MVYRIPINRRKRWVLNGTLDRITFTWQLLVYHPVLLRERDIAKTFDALGCPLSYKQRYYCNVYGKERWVDWGDQVVPDEIKDAWLQWLASKQISRCYFPSDAQIRSVQIHGFMDFVMHRKMHMQVSCISEWSIRIRMCTSPWSLPKPRWHRLTIPRLELCGAYLLSQLLHHIRDLFSITMDNIFAWTDSTIVLGWLNGNPRRLKTFVGNRRSDPTL